MSEKLLEEIEKRLNAKTIHDLRQIARALDVPHPTDGRKGRILEYILGIASGEKDPVAHTVKGAPPKSTEYDRQLVADVLKCREISLSAKRGEEPPAVLLTVSSGEQPRQLEFTAEGILEKTDGRWFIRVNGCRENFISDIFVNDFFINHFKLREGDFICGKCKRSSPDEMAGLATLSFVNGILPDLLQGRVEFDNLTPAYPDRRLRLECGSDDLTGRIIDLLSPVGAGQRAVITAPHGCGKTSVLKDIARGIKRNNNQVKLIVLLVDARPEEASDFKRAFPGTDVLFSPIEAGSKAHVRTARLALEYAKRQTETMKDVVLVLDDLTRLARAYNSCGKQVTAALDTYALDSIKTFFAAARNTEEGASLTIISALSFGGGDPVDEAVYSGLKDLCSMRITLSAQLARSRVYPPVNIAETGASGDERLLSPQELAAAAKLREESIQNILSLFTHTHNNAELCESLTK